MKRNIHAGLSYFIVNSKIKKIQNSKSLLQKVRFLKVPCIKHVKIGGLNEPIYII